jgi:ABC-type transport system involved in cytochrome bd biosynthesis fused ATPase/permease subunit
MNTATTERNTFREHRRREARLVTTVLAVLGGIGFTAAVVPAVEHAITTGLLAAAALLVLVLVVRVVARRLADRAAVTAGRRAA